MKTFTKFKQELQENVLSEEVYFGDMTDELLFDLLASESVDEYHFINALITLYERELIELGEEDLENLFEAFASLPAPQSKSVVPATNNMPAAKSTAVGRPLPTQNALPGSGIKDVVGGKRIYPNNPSLSAPSSTNAAKTVTRTLSSRLGPQAAALGVGLGAGYAAKKALNAVGPGADNNKSTGNIAKANVKSPGSGVKFKGDVPTIPSDNKPKFSDNTKGMKLTGKTFDPTKAALSAGFSSSSPEPAKKLIGPIGGAKSSSTTSQKPVIAQKSGAQASSAQKPMQKAPIQKKSLPAAKKPEADPNAGGGFVTARAYGSKSGGITGTQNRYGQGNKSTFLKPTPKKDVASGGKWM